MELAFLISSVRCCSSSRPHQRAERREQTGRPAGAVLLTLRLHRKKSLHWSVLCSLSSANARLRVRSGSYQRAGSVKPQVLASTSSYLQLTNVLKRIVLDFCETEHNSTASGRINTTTLWDWNQPSAVHSHSQSETSTSRDHTETRPQF